MSELDNWVILLGNFGFPILIAVYLLMRFERKIESLSTVINDLKNILKKNQ